MSDTTSCAYCGIELDAEAVKRACAACSLWGGGCRMVRCPRCGYESPEEPGLIRWIRSRRRRRDVTAQP